MSEQKVLSEKDVERLDKMKEALKDPAFVEKLANLEKPEDVQVAFKENDVELSLDEINQIKSLIENVGDSNGELSDDDLDNIVGGKTDVGALIRDLFNAVADVFEKHDFKW